MKWNHRVASSRTVTFVVAAGIVGTLAVSGVALASTSKSYLACSSSKHHLSLLTAKGKCKAGTSKVTLGARGPKGAQGDTGSQGIQGIQGIQGNQGVQGIQGNPGPVLPGYLDSVSSPAFDKGNNSVTLADLSVPKDTFMITALVDLHGDANANAIPDVTCTLEAGLDEDSTDVTVPAGSGYVEATMVAAITYVAAGDATLVCNNHNTAVFATSARIMATPAGSVNYSTN